jgi:hypothetical protein
MFWPPTTGVAINNNVEVSGGFNPRLPAAPPKAAGW